MKIWNKNKGKKNVDIKKVIKLRFTIAVANMSPLDQDRLLFLIRYIGLHYPIYLKKIWKQKKHKRIGHLTF